MIQEINIFDFESNEEITNTSSVTSNLAEVQDIVVESFQDKLNLNNYIILEQIHLYFLYF